MLFVLTGDVQTGKTRWLDNLVHDLKRIGITCRGVIAPGVWADRRNETERSSFVDANGFEKLGIDNVLLPNDERITFAQRADIALSANSYDANSQSAHANLRWHISDEAIKRVNEHFAKLGRELVSSNAPGILIVDELGQLELKRGGGLTSAMALLDQGPYPATQHALIVVRESLLPLLDGRFENWGETILVKPDEPSRQTIIDTVRE